MTVRDIVISQWDFSLLEKNEIYKMSIGEWECIEMEFVIA